MLVKLLQCTLLSALHCALLVPSLFGQWCFNVKPGVARCFHVEKGEQQQLVDFRLVKCTSSMGKHIMAALSPVPLSLTVP
jgi:hypothetical protein